MTPAERLAWLRLARTESIGPVAFGHLLARFGSASAALEALPELARRGGRSGPLETPSAAESEREIERGEAQGGILLLAGQPPYPPLLAAVDPPPPVLWALGDPAILSRPCVALVGARIASAGGQRFARGMAAELGRAGQVIVSGMARGIDGAAHEGALPTGTVAVLAGGFDDIYPPEHRALHARIAAEGCVVSEREPGRKAQARDFPRRNRIIAGLSRAVVVVEAELKSGSLITARLAAEQGREVLAVPGSPLDPRSKGTNDLIRQGAALCEGADDVLRTLETLPGLYEPPERYDATDWAAQDAEADGVRDRIEALLSPVPTPHDELVRASGASAHAVLAALVELSLADRAVLLPGGLAARP